MSCGMRFLKLSFTLDRCDKLKLLVLGAHASHHVDLFQSQPHGVLLLGPAHYVDGKQLTRGQRATQENGKDI